MQRRCLGSGCSQDVRWRPTHPFGLSRRATKRRATKRRETKRRETKRRETKRRETKRRATKRRATKRRATKRRATDRLHDVANRRYLPSRMGEPRRSKSRRGSN